MGIEETEWTDTDRLTFLLYAKVHVNWLILSGCRVEDRENKPVEGYNIIHEDPRKAIDAAMDIYKRKALSENSGETK